MHDYGYKRGSLNGQETTMIHALPKQAKTEALEKRKRSAKLGHIRAKERHEKLGDYRGSNMDATKF